MVNIPKIVTFAAESIKIIVMKELLSKIGEVYTAFAKNSVLQIENGNKAAGMRARKASLKLEKMMKEFRKGSLEMQKK